ncbi:MAG TPA: Rieske (2Fe-2S) protein [Myxococcota bacterium]|nr:Rieske (2Fe-2S) protein [Myxococcota bacterium]HQK51367.1 Rieske (2Fe-2S) protein [Myxococcota bacterium]
MERPSKNDDRTGVGSSGRRAFLGGAVVWAASAVAAGAIGAMVTAFRALGRRGTSAWETDGAGLDGVIGAERLGPGVLLRSTAEGPRAWSLRCPHLGCTVIRTADGFRCPCHGSRFDDQGNRLEGPAPEGLAPLPVQRVGTRWRVRTREGGA